MSQLNSLFVQTLTSPVATITGILNAPNANIANLTVGTMSGGGGGTLSAASANLSYLSSQTANIASLVVGTLSGGGAGVLSTGQISAVSGNIVTLTSQAANLTQITAQSANITSLVVGTLSGGGTGTLSTGQISAVAGNIVSLTSQSANITSLVVGTLSGGGTGTLSTGQISAVAGNIVTLTSQAANLTQITAQSANITSLVVGTLSGGGTGTLSTGQISAVAGNIVSLTSQAANLTQITAQSANITSLVVGTLSGGGTGTLSTGQISAVAGNIVTLTSQAANLTQITAQSANITSLVVGTLSGGGTGTLSTGQISAVAGNIVSLTSQAANLTQITAQSANITSLVVGTLSGGGTGTLSTGQISAVAGNIVSLTSQAANLTQITAQSANITSLVVGTLSGGGTGTLSTGQISAVAGNIVTVTSQAANLGQITAQSANITSLVVGTLSGGGTGTLSTGQISAVAGNIVTLTSQAANLGQITAQSANITSLVVGTLSGGGTGTLSTGQISAVSGNIASLTSQQANLNVLNANVGNLVVLVSQVSTLGNVQGPLTVAGDIVFTGNLRQTLFGNAPGGGPMNYTFGNLAASNLSIVSVANVGSLGAGTIFCSNIVGYSAGSTFSGNLIGQTLQVSNIQVAGPITVTTSGVPGDLLSKQYASLADRYGIGQYNTGTKVFTSATNSATGVGLSIASTDTSAGNAATFQDLLLASNTSVVVNRPLVTGAKMRATYALTLASTVGAFTTICNITDPQATTTFVLNITLVQSRSYNGLQKTYKIPVSYNSAPFTNWYRVLPDTNSGNNNGNDFSLDVYTQNGNPYATFVRVVRTAVGSNTNTGITAFVEVLSDTGFPVSFNYDGSTGNAATVVGTYAATPLTTIGGSLGIMTATPQYTLDVNGSVRANTATVFQQNASGQTGFFIGNNMGTNQSGFVTFNSPNAPGAPGSTGLGVFGVSAGLTVGPSGNVGINQVAPQTALDVGGNVRALNYTTQVGLNNSFIGNTYPAAVTFNYGGSGGNYQHAIRTRHNAGVANQNSIDMYTWVPADGLYGAPNNLAMAVTSTGVGVGNVPFPQYPMDVAGTARTAVNASSRATALRVENLNTGGAAGTIDLASQFGPLANPNKICGQLLGEGDNFSGGRIIVTTANTTGNLNPVLTINALQNVGINTITPAYPLDVAGAARVTGSLLAGARNTTTFNINLAATVGAYTQIVNFSDQTLSLTYNLTVVLVQSRNSNAIIKTHKIPIQYNVATFGSWYRVLPEANSGINNGNDFALDIIVNNSNPSYLRVVRTAVGSNTLTGMTAIVEFTADNGSPVTVTYDGTTGTGATNVGLYGLAPLTTTPGFVGILNQTPAYPLDVAGAARVTGQVIVGNIADGSIGQTASIVNRVANLSYAMGVQPVSLVNSYGNPTYNYVNTDYNIINQNGAQPGGRFIVNDCAYSTDMRWQTRAPGSASNSLVDRFTVVCAGFVGVNNPYPAAQLDVNGGLRANGTIFQQTTTPIIFMGTAQASNQCGFINYNNPSSPNALGLGIYGVSQSLTIATTGLVGVNTTSPGYNLDVAGVTRSAVNSSNGPSARPTALRIENIGSGTGGATIDMASQYSGLTQPNKICGQILAEPDAGSGGRVIITTSNTAGQLTPLMFMNASMQVGINTTTPGYTLDVNGPTRVSGQLYQSTPVTWFYKITTNSSTATGWIPTSKTMFTYQSGPSKTSSDNLFIADATPSNQSQPNAVISMPYSGIWALQWSFRLNATGTENSSSFCVMSSSTYGETGTTGATGVRLGYGSTSSYNLSTTYTGYFAVGDTLALALYSSSSNYIINGVTSYLSAVLVQRVA